MKRLQTINKIFTDIIEENNRLKHEIEIMKLTKSPKEHQIDQMTLELIEIGRKSLFEKCMYAYGGALQYDEDGVNKTYEEWFEAKWRDSNVPNFISVDLAKEVIEPVAREEYAKELKNARLEYARSQRNI